jgi:4-amino-4-deoxy-L-arabinose transferase-like glycosyltransferase
MIGSCRSVNWLLVAVTASITGFAFQGSRGLYETTEGRYAECAREMLDSGNWFEPALDGRPHWTKPPMTYWAIAAGMLLFGRNEWGVRFHLALSFVLVSLLAAALAGRMWGPATGTVAGVVYATSFFPAAASNMVSADNLLTLWEAAAVTCYYFAISSTSKPRSRRWILGMWLMSGLAFLTKGPPGLIFLAAVIPFHLIRRKRGIHSASLFNVPGMFLFAVVGFGWFLRENLLHPGLLASLAGDEVVARITTDRFHRNPQWYAPFVLYLPIVLFGCAPWAWYWVQAARKRGEKWPARSIARGIAQSPNSLFLILWAGVPLVIFSLAKSRLPLYILPLMMPLAIATARVVELASEQAAVGKRLFHVGLASVVLIVAVKAAGPLYPAGLADMKELYRAVAGLTGDRDYDVSLYRESRLWGLQFYENRHLDRLGGEGDAWADRTLDTALEEMIRPGGSALVLVARPSHRDELLADLTSHGIDGEEHLSPGGWSVILIGNPTRREMSSR